MASAPLSIQRKPKTNKYQLTVDKNDQIALAARVGDVEKLTALVKSLDPKKEKGVINKLHNKMGKNGIQLAAEGGFTDAIRVLADFRADLNFKDKDGNSAAVAAARYDQVDSIATLRDLGADIHLAGHGGDTPLHISCRYGHLATAQKLHSLEADLEVRNDLEESSLAHAIKFENTVMADWLLSQSADVNARGSADHTPLTRCAFDNRLHNMLVYLLEKGADVHVQITGGETALHIACRQQHIKAVESLLQHGASVNITDDAGRTPLMIACSSGSPTSLEISAILIESGASVDAADMWGYTPLMYASKAIKPKEIIIDMLLKRDADINATDNSSHTALSFACKAKHYDIARLLLVSGADRRINNDMNKSPFDFIEDETIRQSMVGLEETPDKTLITEDT